MRFYTALIALTLLGCRGDDKSAQDQTGDSPGVEAAPFGDCDPLSPEACGYPFPSTFYMVEDSSTPTGWRVNLGETTLPANTRGVHASPALWNERDGWTIAGPIMAHLPTVTVAGVAGFDDIGASLEDDSPTLIVDLDTGERVAHWVERDVRLEDSENSVLMLRPAQPLAFGHRYVVGLRNLVDATGAAVPAPEAYVALRDGGATDDSDIEGRRALYADVIFPALQAQGWDPADTQLSWDFVTGSREGITGQAVAARDRALDAVSGGIDYRIDSIEVAPDEHTAFRVFGSFTAPLFTDKDGPGALLTRDEDNLPFQNGTTEVPFTVIVPNSLVQERRAGTLVQYGHGLLGGQGEVEGGYLAEMADRYGWVLFAVDWTGMKSQDAPMIAVLVQNDIGNISAVPERSIQGFVEFQVATRLMMTELVEDPALVLEATDSEAAAPLIDPTEVFYYGNSQGGILGACFVALSKDVQRGVLGVVGGPYSLLLTRSSDFDTFLTIFNLNWPDPKDISLWLALVQTVWDSAEPAGYVDSTAANPLPDTPAKDVLMQVAIGDKQVTPLGAQWMARAYGAPLIGSPARPVWGLETVASGHAGSALVEYDYGIEVPDLNVPPETPDPHEWPRREFSGQEQINAFFETGTVVDFCAGVCGDPSRGAGR